MAFGSALAGLLSPFFQKIFVDRLIGSAWGEHSLSSMSEKLAWLNQVHPLVLIGIAFVCTLLAQGFSLLTNFAGLREGLFLQKILSEDLYEKTLSMRSDAMGATTVGEVVSIYAVDVPGSTAIVDQAIPMGANIVFPLIFAPLAILWICGIPMTATLIVMGVTICLNVVLATRQSRFFFRFKILAAERTGIVNEWVQSIRLLRILGWMEAFESKIFQKREEETLNRVAMVTNGQLMNSFGSSITYLINLSGVAALVFFRKEPVSAGELFALLWIFGVFLTRPFRQIPWIFTFTLDSLTSLRRLEAFFARRSDAGTFDLSGAGEDAPPLETGPLPIEVLGLTLDIGGHRKLDGIDFDIKAGEFVAIVGEVGSGKSLLILSLMGETAAQFTKFRIGSIDVTDVIDASGIARVDLNSRRRFFTFVPQEGFVMSASLRDNVAFRYQASPAFDEGITHSLAVSQFSIVNEQVRDGLDTEIGERGVNLSGGQRQRVSLARAHFLARPIVLLDDCLSAVDVDTERKLIHDLIDGEWKGKTRLLVTHRLSVLSRVDRVLFMENGKIVETGTFNELFQRSERVRDYVASVQKASAIEKEEVVLG